MFASQTSRASPGHNAAFRPQALTYQLEKWPANTVVARAWWMPCVAGFFGGPLDFDDAGAAIQDRSQQRPDGEVDLGLDLEDG